MSYRYELGGKWEFASVRGKYKSWMVAEVPGCLHTDLMENKVILDPFFRFNEHDAMVYERTDWKYRKQFLLDSEQYSSLMQRRVRLVCKGLDTFATVKLNGKLVGKTENMFVEHSFDIAGLLRKGPNELVIMFDSAVRLGEQLMNTFGRTSEGYPFEIRSYVRKAQYSFGWDWGPELPTMGIWKNIYIESCNEKISDVCFRIISADEKLAQVKVSVELDLPKSGQRHCEIELAGQTKVISPGSAEPGKVISRKFTIKKPKLWMPRGYGEPNLYTLKVKLVSGNAIIDSKELLVGIRTVKLVREKDDEGRTFYFKANGVPVYCRGANFIPTDNFLHRTTDEKYRALLQMAADANMNMLRIWGGGIYEKDIFYDLCDRLGIMVWQDFMFACAIYPHSKFFLRNVDMEARKVVKRLRNHPCITIWSGENENHIWFGNQKETRWKKTTHNWWGGKNWNWGQKIYHDVLPKVCKELDPAVPYVPGSPIGSGPNGDLNANGMKDGDRHAWDVWSGWQDYSAYQQDTGRFQSEFGFQAPATMRTIKEYSIDDDLHPQSRWMDHHNKMGEGNPRLYKFLSDHFIVPTGLDEFVYLCQVNQGEALKTGVEHFRRRKFKTSGALIWQMNDCWPVTSWSLVDSESRPKLSYYYAKRFFAPVLVSIVEKGNDVEVWITNDTMTPITGKLHLRSFVFSGRKRASKSIDVKVSKNSSRCFMVTTRAKMNINSPEWEFLNAKLVVGRKTIAQNNLVFDRIKHLALNEAIINKSIVQLSERKFRIRLCSKSFVKACTISFRRLEPTLSDNCFDLVPGDERIIICETAREIELKSLNSGMKIRSVRSLKTGKI